MTTYALHTKTMLSSASDPPTQLLRLAAKRDEPKTQLPSKHKRDSLCGLGASNKPFNIRPHPESPYDKPVTLKPVRVIGRSQLPLTFLDTSPDDNFASNSLFAAHIDVLEGNVHVQETEDEAPRVLIARFDTKRTLYAIERVQPRVYSICRLANWLKEKDVADLWDPLNLQSLSVRPKPDTDTITTGNWWQHAVVEAKVEAPSTQRARMTMMRPKTQPGVIKPEPHQSGQLAGTVESKSLDANSVHLPVEPLLGLPPPQEQLALLVQQYLDAMYMSKTSLAYFAKGPITRIRNTFTSSEQGAPPTHELITFLRSMLLSPKASEKKYYDKVPSIIKALPPGSFSDDEPAAGAVKAKTSKKKVKLSREGVYPQEEAFIKKWWQSELPGGDSAANETLEQRIRRRIGDLRVRETLAQLILMLEIVALEALSARKPPPEEQPAPENPQIQDEPQTVPKKRKRKLDDINLQLDLLLDKLCIWHATEEVGILEFDVKPSKQNDNSDGTGRDSSNDRLHSFCVEVIIPFYINRLPEQALMVNKKLGGPAHSSPSKRKAMKPPIISRKSGESKEPEKKKSRRSLARVATDNTGRTVERTTPSLSRSATDSALNDIKREGSEVPLSAIPFQRSPSKSARQSMSQIRHLQGREVDFAQPSAAAAAKLKHKQRVEEDLQDAILALKKPNRGLAAGGYIADIEQRGLGLPNKSRKPTTTVRKTIKDVQVSATPRVGKRTKNMVEQTPTRHHDPFVRLSAGEAPPSSDFCVPSSGARLPPTMVPATGHRNATIRSVAQSSIAETPSKAPSTKPFSSGSVRRKIFATPVKAAAAASPDGPSHVFETPAKPLGSSPPRNVNSAPPVAVATPTKSVPVTAFEAVPILPSVSAKHDEETSIYDVLGWNDDDDGFV